MRSRKWVVQRVPPVLAGVPAHQREVLNPQRGPHALGDEVPALGKPCAQGAEHLRRHLLVVGHQGDEVAGHRTEICDEAIEELGDRGAQRAVLLHDRPHQALRTKRLGLGHQLVAILARHTLTGARHHQPAHHSPAVHHALEHCKVGGAGSVGPVLDLHCKAQVGTVAAITAHRLVVSHTREWRGDLDARLCEARDQHALGEVLDVLGLNERCLDVELRELGLAVGAQILVTEAAGNLVVALQPAHHEQLLEQLRALRKGVPVALAQARGHQKVACALGRAAREHGGLNLKKAVIVEYTPHGPHHTGAQFESREPPGPAHVDIAVGEP